MPTRRHLVLEELVRTERDYVAGLSLVKKKSQIEFLFDELDLSDNCYIDKLKHEPEFPAEVMKQIFLLAACNQSLNLEDILNFHSKLLKHLEDADIMGTLGACEEVFLSHRDDFMIYTEFCNHHERGVSLLYELLSSQTAFALIKSCQLLSNSQLNLESYLLSVVQRICKYPLLMKELVKGTEPPYQSATQAALDISYNLNHHHIIIILVVVLLVLLVLLVLQLVTIIVITVYFQLEGFTNFFDTLS
eukprot:gene100-3493_t